ncbi:hypothetical protein PIB30_062298 [Stylosanthes scabra]|uniref:Uncharacterized protein n=1 Tax=Stylosanthes scabra TaxID=79078 RepID=A0ABU6VJG2_9FABA|nr:hypothetical protein [Stylosanthes scabra]
MSRTNAKNDSFDPSGSTASSGSIVSLGPVISTANTQSIVAVSTSIGSTRLSTEVGQKQFHDGNRPQVTARGSLNSGGWPLFGMPLNYTLATILSDPRGLDSSSVQFGSVPNDQVHSDINCNMATSSSSQPLSTAAV